VNNARVLRETVDVCRTAAISAQAQHSPLDVLTNLTDSVSRLTPTPHIIGLEQHKRDTLEMLEAQIREAAETHRPVLNGISTGYPSLDRYTAGFHPGELIMIAARPSVGKSALALNLAVRAAQAGRGVMFFSIEMPSWQMMFRAISIIGRVDNHRLHKGTLSKDQFEAAIASVKSLCELPLWIDETSTITPTQIHSRAKEQQARHLISLVIVDYLQLIRAARQHDSKQVEVSEISAGLKAMARDLNVPVIAISQVSRAAVHGDGGSPQLHHLRDSGALEQDADVVLMLHRKDKKEDMNLVRNVDMRIEKQRNGQAGVTIPFSFILAEQRFEEREWKGRDESEVEPKRTSYAERSQPPETEDEEGLF
jgi:replicative DNA helicase